MQIWYISDGKAGHRVQMLGLVSALQRQSQHPDLDQSKSHSVVLHEIPQQQLSSLGLWLYWLTGGRVGQLPTAIQTLPAPTLIAGVGHRTHWKVFLLKKILQAHHPLLKSLILMQPSLPLNWFDYLIIPQHDQPPVQPHILVTQGVLNPLVNAHQHLPKHGLILIGGPSKRHGWSTLQVLEQIQNILAQNPEFEIILTTSRRTPADFLQQPFFEQLPPKVSLFPVEQTPNGWLFAQLQQASQVWVTEDSVSMLYEALTAGCQVTIMPVPRLRQDRITEGVDALLKQGDVQVLGKKHIAPPPKIALNEAERAAQWLISQLPARQR